VLTERIILLIITVTRFVRGCEHWSLGYNRVITDVYIQHLMILRDRLLIRLNHYSNTDLNKSHFCETLPYITSSAVSGCLCPVWTKLSTTHYVQTKNVFCFLFLINLWSHCTLNSYILYCYITMLSYFVQAIGFLRCKQKSLTISLLISCKHMTSLLRHEMQEAIFYI